jgi:hypothetical protein
MKKADRTMACVQREKRWQFHLMGWRVRLSSLVR